MKRIHLTILTLLFGLFLNETVLATTVLPLSLERMSKNAELIFYGTATENKVARDETSGHIATFTSFDVIEVIKGNTGDTHTIKQIGGRLPGSGTTRNVHGVPRFVVGEKYIVFLPQESSLGFASPLGLNQGRFIVQEKNGISTVKKARLPGTSLGKPADTLGKQPTDTSLTEFIQTVRGLAAE